MKGTVDFYNKTAADGLFSFEEEVGIDGTVWHNYIFRQVVKQDE